MTVRHYFVYILANNRPTLYIGVTNNLYRRVLEHRLKVADGFTKKYNVFKLVYYEEYLDIQRAIEREKQIKHWNRDWKLQLIKKQNPTFTDLCGKLEVL